MKAVIFDMDGVIFDSERIWQESYILANKKYNLNLDEKFRQKTCGMNEKDTRNLLNKLFPDLNIDEYRNYMQVFFETYIKKNGAPIKQGFLELINFLKTKNCKIGLATGNERQFVEIMFNSVNLDLYSLFNFVVAGEEVKKGKPDPEIYLKIVNGLNVNAQDCFVLEDSINGIKSAKTAGCNPIMVIDLIKPNKYVKQNAFNICSNLIEAKDIISKNL